MKRIYSLLFVILSMSIIAVGQEYPKLKAIGKRNLEERIFPAEKKSKWGFATEKGKFLIDPVFDEVCAFSCAGFLSDGGAVYLAKVRFGDKWGVVKRNGTYLVAPEYDEIYDFNGGTAIVRSGKSYGLLSYFGNVLIEGLQEVDDFGWDGLALFKEDDLWGVIDLDGYIHIPNTYTSKPEKHVTPSLLLTSVGEKKGLISTDLSREVIEPFCDSIVVNSINNAVVLYSRDGLWGCLTADGSKVVDPIYEKIELLPQNNTPSGVVVMKNGKYGLLGQNCSVVLPPVFRTNQFTASRQFYKGFKQSDEGYDVPILYYDRNRCEIDQFDDLFLKMYPDDYSDFKEWGKQFPHWMRRHLYKNMDQKEASLFWSEMLDAFYWTGLKSGSLEERMLRTIDDCSIVLNRDMSISCVSGALYSDDMQLSSAKLEYSGYTYPCGELLTSLFRSVDVDKVRSFDDRMQSNLYYSWNSISFMITGLQVFDDGQILLCVDMYLDEYHVQRIITCLDQKGYVLYTYKQDGVIYDVDHGVSTEQMDICVIDDIVVVSSKYIDGESKRMTVLYNGNVCYENSGIILMSLFELDDMTVLFAEDNYANGRLYSISQTGEIRDLNKSFSGNESLKYLDMGIFVLTDKETELPVSTFNIYNMTMGEYPVLRNGYGIWDGERIMALSKNFWHPLTDASWLYIPKLSSDVGKQQFSLDNLVVTVYPVNQWGGCIYSVAYETSPEECKYGFINFVVDPSSPFMFTPPLFDKVKWISKDRVSIEIHNSEEEVKYKEELTLKSLQNNFACGERKTIVEHKPLFQGGDANQFSKWVNERLVYPETAKKQGITGRVLLSFTVDRDGSVINVKVLRGIHPDLDKEAVRVVSMSPKWKPGSQRGRTVPVTYTFPVNFGLVIEDL